MNKKLFVLAIVFSVLAALADGLLMSDPNVVMKLLRLK